MTPQPASEIALAAALLTEGALVCRSEKEREVLYSYEGCSGFLVELVDMVEMTVRIEEEAFKILEDRWDICYGYEVTSAYGAWFAQETIKNHGVPPGKGRCVDELFDLIVNSFKRMVPSEEQQDRINKMLIEERIRV